MRHKHAIEENDRYMRKNGERKEGIITDKSTNRRIEKKIEKSRERKIDVTDSERDKEDKEKTLPEQPWCLRLLDRKKQWFYL